MKNFPIGIVDEDGGFHTIIINENFLVELTEKLRSEGIVPVHTSCDKGNIKTYNIQAFTVFAKGCKGKMMFLPE